MKISTRPLPGHLHTSAGFWKFKSSCDTTKRLDFPSSIRGFPLQVRYYTEMAVFWRESQDELYMFKLSPREVGSIRWGENEDGVIVDRDSNYAPVEVEPVSDLELLFLFS